MSESSYTPENLKYSPKKSDLRFRAGMRVNSEMVVKKPSVEGWENFYDLPKGVTPVIAVTHLTDTDPQIVSSAFDNICKVGLASLQTNQEDPLLGKLVALAGRGNFFDIENRIVNTEEKYSYRFNPADFDVMERAVRGGVTMVVAAHRPVYKERVLPDTPGLAAVYLAQRTSRVILPVAVDFHTDERVGMADDIGKTIKNLVQRNKPEATIRIGEPLFLKQIPPHELKLVSQALSSTERRLLTEEQRRQALALLPQIAQQLQAQGDMVMLALAAELPEKSRGIWNEKLKQIPPIT